MVHELSLLVHDIITFGASYHLYIDYVIFEIYNTAKTERGREMDKNKIIGAREYEVARHNDLIQKSRLQLTLQEQKILQYIISLIKPSDTALQEYEIKISDFCAVCGIVYESGKNHKDLKNNVQKLADKSFWVKDDKGEDVLLRWLSTAKINNQGSAMTVKLHEDLMPYLIQLKKNYTRYTLKYVLAMQSKYSVRLYEILRSYLYRGEPVTFDLEDLKRKIDAVNYKLYGHFVDRVLEPAKAEINALTDIRFEYEPIKTGRKVTGVRFHAAQKADMGERLDAWAKIEKKLEAKKTRGKKS